MKKTKQTLIGSITDNQDALCTVVSLWGLLETPLYKMVFNMYTFVQKSISSNRTVNVYFI